MISLSVERKVPGEGVKGEEAAQLLNIRLFTMWALCDNVTTHLPLKQEAEVGRKHTAHPHDDISK